MKCGSFCAILIFIVLNILVISCKKEHDPDPNSLPTQVKVNVQDLNGSKVPGAKVYLYNNGPALDSSISDANGSVLFTVNYLLFGAQWVVVKGCEQNTRDTGVSVNVHTLNTFTSVLYPTGILKITKVNADAYNVSATSTFTRELDGTGVFCLFLEQGLISMKSGLVSAPNVSKDTVFHISCADTVRITLPY